MEKRVLKLNLEQLKNYNIFKEELLSLELLKNQGFNNISYLLKTTNKSYVIRVFKSKELSLIHISSKEKLSFKRLIFQ